jgi:hypothetical protein
MVMGGTSVARATTPVPVDSISSLESESGLPEAPVELLPLSDLVGYDFDNIEYQPGPAPDTTQTVEAAAETVFARPEFGYDREIHRWEPKELPTFAGFDLSPLLEWFDWITDWDTSGWFDGWFDWLDRDSEPADNTDSGWDGNGASSVLEVLMWGLVAALVVGGVVLLWRRREEFSRAPLLDRPTPERTTTTGGDIRGPKVVVAPEATIPEKVWAVWTSGDADTALAMLYNAALAELTAAGNLELDDAWTEGDCARAVRKHVGGTRAQYFQRVVRARTCVSYAHRAPEDHVVKSLCDDWAQLGGKA